MAFLLRSAVVELGLVVAAVYAALLYAIWPLPTDLFWTVAVIGVLLAFAGFVLGAASLLD